MEITSALNLKSSEIALLKMHSVLQVLNAVQYDLLRLSDYLENPSELEKASNSLFYFSEDLNDPHKAAAQLASIDNFCSQLLASCKAALNQKAKSNDAHGQEVIAGLSDILSVLKLRAQELAARQENADNLQRYTGEELKKQFLYSLNALEENDHGAYHLVNELAQNFKDESQLSLQVKSLDEKPILLAPVFIDIVRDLLVNARQYTGLDGSISVGIEQNETETNLVVQDSGQGIPSDELSKVVEFRYRATNTKSRPTRGGGFGLTKAYYFTQNFGGRMFIESPCPGETNGTKVSIKLPLPKS